MITPLRRHLEKLGIIKVNGESLEARLAKRFKIDGRILEIREYIELLCGYYIVKKNIPKLDDREVLQSVLSIIKRDGLENNSLIMLTLLKEYYKNPEIAVGEAILGKIIFEYPVEEYKVDLNGNSIIYVGNLTNKKITIENGEFYVVGEIKNSVVTLKKVKAYGTFRNCKITLIDGEINGGLFDCVVYSDVKIEKNSLIRTKVYPLQFAEATYTIS